MLKANRVYRHRETYHLAVDRQSSKRPSRCLSRAKTRAVRHRHHHYSIQPPYQTPSRPMSKVTDGSRPPWRLRELLERAGIKESAFREMRRTGAVSPPGRPTSSAYYDLSHLKQIQAVLRLADRQGISRAAACNLIGLSRSTPLGRGASSSRIRQAAALCFSGAVRKISDGIFLVSAKPQTAAERTLLDATAKHMRRELAVRLRVQDCTSPDSRRTTVHRIK